MIDKFAVSCISTCYKVKAKLDKLCKAEDGMETVESVMLIAIAVIIAGFIINFLTKGNFGGSSNQGLIGYMFEEIGKSIKGMFEVDTTINPGS
ncbi:MAG: hypothetical protein IJM46_09680 [Oscillospiraceae bacterium]|nr:hypothetical protein [Oscillospiraceae bacterium]